MKAKGIVAIVLTALFLSGGLLASYPASCQIIPQTGHFQEKCCPCCTPGHCNCGCKTTGSPTKQGRCYCNKTASTLMALPESSFSNKSFKPALLYQRTYYFSGKGDIELYLVSKPLWLDTGLGFQMKCIRSTRLLN